MAPVHLCIAIANGISPDLADCQVEDDGDSDWPESSGTDAVFELVEFLILVEPKRLVYSCLRFSSTDTLPLV